MSLKDYVLDPSKAMSEVLNNISTANTELNISDPTNPFIMLLEATATLTSIGVNETLVTERNIYPKLAKDNVDIYRHISDEDIIGIQSLPSEASMIFRIKLQDIQTYGVVYDDYIKTSIPINTKINYSGVYFTLLNKIDIYYYNNGKVTVEQTPSTSEIGIDYLGILPHSINTDNENIDWLMFETIVKQIDRQYYRENLITSSKFIYDIDLLNNDKFYFCEVYLNINGGSVIKLNNVYNDTVFDLDNPSVFIKFLENKIRLEIPMIYQISNSYAGTIEIILYTTKGNYNVQLENADTSNFTIITGDSLTSEESSIDLMNKFVLSRGITSIGKNGKTLEEIRESVIFNTIGKIDTPITDKELKEASNRKNFDIVKARDTVTDRTYIASRNLIQSTDSDIKTRADMFMNSISISLDDIKTDNMFMFNDKLIIKSKTIFKYENGITSVLPESSVVDIKNMVKRDLIEYLKTNNLFYNPLHYIIDKDSTILNSRVYNLDTPSLSNLRITAKNNYISPKLNINSMGISKTSTGYKILFSVIGNEDFNNLRPAFSRAQLKIKLNNSDEYLYFTTSADLTTGYFSFDINSNFYIDENNGIKIENGISDIPTKYINLSDTLQVIFYTLDPMLVKEKTFMDDDIIYSDKSSLNVITAEELTYTFGTELQYLWNRVVNFYTDRKFKKYTTAKYAKYTEDIYKVYPETNSIFNFVYNDEGEVIEIITEKIHKKGDYILDDNGNPVVIHNIGDFILDENGNPIIDGTSGVVRQIDILMFEYLFLVSEGEYADYNKEFNKTLVNWLTNDISSLNDLTLEQTKILFKPYKKSGYVKTIVNNTYKNNYYYVKPKVTIYVGNNVDTSINVINSFIDTIGNILHEDLEESSFNLNTTKEKILNSLGSEIKAIKIENLNTDNDEYFQVYEGTGRFTLAKNLYLNSNNELNVRYNIDVTIQVV